MFGVARVRSGDMVRGSAMEAPMTAPVAALVKVRAAGGMVVKV